MQVSQVRPDFFGKMNIMARAMSARMKEEDGVQGYIYRILKGPGAFF
jgi:hypothetical protein